MKEDPTVAMPETADDDADVLSRISELIRRDMLRYTRRLDAEEENSEL